MPYAFITILIFLGIFKFLEKFLSLATGIKGQRHTGGYQGGEAIDLNERRYGSEIFPYTMFFMILHVVGFIAATLFIIVKIDEDPINWASMVFGALILYTTLLIAKGADIKW